MGNAPEVVREVGVNDFRMASEQQPFHLDHRLLGVSSTRSGDERLILNFAINSSQSSILNLKE
jgi:hypothetical protein